ncbi:MAG TPA: acylneuraminate cytidylyltransferase [Maribacter sp.]|nr:acylneuraminate cytidylyltransferase [Maribacter sp.]
MKTIAFIFARGGSKGLPDKNVRLLAGKPLIAWSIDHALSINRIDRVIVSTDSEKIAAISKEYGAETPFLRPAELANDDTPEWLAWRHALNYLVESTGSLPEVMVSVPTTAPLRLPLDIENCLDEYAKGETDMVITTTDSHRNPYFNMVKINSKGLAELVNSPRSIIANRQDVPSVYDMTTVCYVANPRFVMANDSFFQGRVRAVHIPKRRAIDIDTLLDFQIAESLFRFGESKDE